MREGHNYDRKSLMIKVDFRDKSSHYLNYLCNVSFLKKVLYEKSFSFSRSLFWQGYEFSCLNR